MSKLGKYKSTHGPGKGVSRKQAPGIPERVSRQSIMQDDRAEDWVRKMTPEQLKTIADMELLRKAIQVNEAERKKALKEVADRNYSEGHQAGVDSTIIVMLAACALGAHEAFGFGAERCCALLERVIDNTANNLTSEEAVQAVYDAIGLEIVLDDPFEPVKKTEKKPKGFKKVKIK